MALSRTTRRFGHISKDYFEILVLGGSHQLGLGQELQGVGPIVAQAKEMLAMKTLFVHESDLHALHKMTHRHDCHHDLGLPEMCPITKRVYYVYLTFNYALASLVKNQAVCNQTCPFLIPAEWKTCHPSFSAEYQSQHQLKSQHQVQYQHTTRHHQHQIEPPVVPQYQHPLYQHQHQHQQQQPLPVDQVVGIQETKDEVLTFTESDDEEPAQQQQPPPHQVQGLYPVLGGY